MDLAKEVLRFWLNAGILLHMQAIRPIAIHAYANSADNPVTFFKKDSNGCNRRMDGTESRGLLPQKLVVADLLDEASF